MKKFILIFFILGLGKIVLAQTNTFPSSGNVGIGTSNPNAKLDVNGNFYLSSNNSFILFGNNASVHPYLQVNTSNNGLGIGNNDTPKLYVENGGNIGVGTTSPQYKLSIGATGEKIGYYDDINHYGHIEFYNGANGGMYFRNQNASGGGYHFSASGTESLTILNNGNVGIGTTNPNEKFSVNGKIRAKEIKVETGWADFVFKPDYKLRGLKETEQFIIRNGHLPEIPSAKEVEKEGINVGEMNAKLLQKIEELTLHLIEQSKRSDKQEKLNEELQKQINHLKSKL